MKIRSTLLLFILHLFFVMPVNGQQDSTWPNFEIKFLKAKFTDPPHKKSIVVVFQLLAKNPKEFPPMFEPELTYSIDGGPEKTIDAKETKTPVNLQIFGNDFNEKDSSLYNYVKELLIQNGSDYLVIAFYIANISKNGFEKMTFTYGFRETNNPSIRRARKFEFSIEK